MWKSGSLEVWVEANRSSVIAADNLKQAAGNYSSPAAEDIGETKIFIPIRGRELKNKTVWVQK